MVRSTIRNPCSTKIAGRNLIKKSVKQLHKNHKPIKQTKITPTNNIDSQMNDDATSVPTSKTHISRSLYQRLKQSNRPPVDTYIPIDLITPISVQEIEQNRDIELELDGPYLNGSVQANYRSPKETDFIPCKSLADHTEDPVYYINIFLNKLTLIGF